MAKKLMFEFDVLIFGISYKFLPPDYIVKVENHETKICIFPDFYKKHKLEFCSRFSEFILLRIGDLIREHATSVYAHTCKINNLKISQEEYVKMLTPRIIELNEDEDNKAFATILIYNNETASDGFENIYIGRDMNIVKWTS